MKVFLDKLQATKAQLQVWNNSKYKHLERQIDQLPSLIQREFDYR